MCAYHSDLQCDKTFNTSNMAWMPFKSSSKKGGAFAVIKDDETDIIDHIIYYFRPNVFYASFDITNPVDRTYVYGTLYLAECLKKLSRCNTEKDAINALYTMAVSSFDLPGDPQFPLNAFYSAPSGTDAANLETYLKQLRQEIGIRIVPKVFPNGVGPSKWWMCFNKNKFIGTTLVRMGARN